MSLRTENIRQEKLAETQNQLSKADSGRVRVELRSLKDLAAFSPKTAEIEESRRNAEQRAVQEEMAPLSEFDRMLVDYEFNKVAEYFDLDNIQLQDHNSALQVLMGWARENAKNKDVIGIIGYLKRVQKELGYNETGPTAIKRLYQFARLDMDEKRIQREKKLLKK